MKVRIQDNEWRFLGQMMLDIINGLYPGHMGLEAAVLYEWYTAEVQKFTFPKTRRHQLKMSQFLALRRIIGMLPDRYDDPYWQIVKNELASKLDLVAKQATPQLT